MVLFAELFRGIFFANISVQRPGAQNVELFRGIPDIVVSLDRPFKPHTSHTHVPNTYEEPSAFKVAV